jgi:hypothetical protein
MLRALLFLRLTSLKNLVRSRVLRLRQPKYLVGAIFGAAYFYFFFFRHARRSSALMIPENAIGIASTDTAALLMAFAALALLVIVVGMWVLPSEKPGFNFSEAEIAFLFPAPISRRALIHYKLLNTLFTSLLQTVFFSLIFNSRSVLSPHVFQVVCGWWLVLSFTSLHYLASSLTIARLVERGVNARLRRSVILLTLLAVIGACLAWVWRTLPGIFESTSLADWVAAVLKTNAVHVLLWPFQLLLRPFFAKSTGEFLIALGPPLLVLLAHYFWVIRSNVAFEESSIAHAERRAARVAQWRKTGAPGGTPAPTQARRAPFPLERAPWPEFAFLWKNLLSTRSIFTPRVWLITATVIVTGAAVLQRTMGANYWQAGSMIAIVGAFGGLAVLVYGPLLSRLDLRQDLTNADVLKTYPLAGWRVVLGELLAPIVVLSGLVWLGLLAWLVGLHGQQPPQLSPVWFGPGMRIVFVACAAALTPLVIALELLVPNAAPVLFPGWFQAIRTPGGGIDLMGQRLIFGFGQVFVVLLALLPGAATAGLLVFSVQWFAGPAIAVIFATLVVMVVLLGELWCGIWWVGQRFEKLDVSETRT